MNYIISSNLISQCFSTNALAQVFFGAAIVLGIAFAIFGRLPGNRISSKELSETLICLLVIQLIVSFFFITDFVPKLDGHPQQCSPGSMHDPNVFALAIVNSLVCIYGLIAREKRPALILLVCCVSLELTRLLGRSYFSGNLPNAHEYLFVVAVAWLLLRKKKDVYGKK